MKSWTSPPWPWLLTVRHIKTGVGDPKTFETLRLSADLPRRSLTAVTAVWGDVFIQSGMNARVRCLILLLILRSTNRIRHPASVRRD